MAIKVAGLQWAGHLARIHDICVPCRLMYMQPEGLNKVGRPRSRWRDEVEKNARMLEVRSWWAKYMNREEWKKCLKEVKIFGL